MKIALFPNASKQRSKNLSIGIREFLTSRGVEVFCRDSQCELIGATPLSDANPKEIDVMISMGGDGTILRLVHSHPEIEAPILGINLGSLGFMADIPISEIYPSLQELITGSYKVEERLIMEGSIPKEGSSFAVNEIVCHRAKNPCLVELALHIDGSYLNTFSADGIIVSSPCGSTAYSMAAGGPILTPTLNAIVITPICPHTISNRPIVLMPETEIQIQYLSEYDPIEVAFDGVERMPLCTGEVFRLQISKRKFKLVNLLRNDYFATLRSKLGWTGKLKQ